MILEPRSTTVAYRCPSCGSGIMSAVGVFNLSADRVRLKCTNPECASVKKAGDESLSFRDNAALDITLASDGTVRISVPCIFCGKPHVYNVNTSPLHQVAKVLELQLQHQSFQRIFRTDFL